MKKNFKLFFVFASILVTNTINAQSSVLEMQRGTNVGSSNYGFGVNTLPVTSQFSLDALNLGTFVPNSPVSNFTVSFANQQFTGLNYGKSDYLSDGSNINTMQSTGLVFGAGPTIAASQFPSDNIQGAAPINRYDNLGFYSNANGGPKNSMFTSGQISGLGVDVQNTDPSKLNGGIFLFTTAQVLFNDTIAHPKGSRAYFGDIVITFNQPVLNPIINLAGLGGSYRYVPAGTPPPFDVISKYRSTFFTTELELASAGYSTTLLSGNTNFALSGTDNNNIINNNHTTPNGGSTIDPSEFPDSYGAASGSIKVNGVVKQLVYRVYLQGGSASEFAWSARGFDNANNQLITNAGKDPFTGDIWSISASYDKPTQQISGNVFDDKDGLTDNNINQSGGVANPTTNVGGLLYANLLNSAGNVVTSVPVGNNGAYLFDAVLLGVYTVQLTTNSSTGTYTSPAVPPATKLPVGWVNTGENNGSSTGSDGVVNGLSAPITVAANEIKENINFGIERLSTAVVITLLIPRPALNSTITLNTEGKILSGSDPEDQPLPAVLTGKSVKITVLPDNSLLLYNNVAVTLNQIISNFNPDLLQIKFTFPTTSDRTEFSYTYVDAAGFSGAPATYTVQWASGGALPVTLTEFTAIKNNCTATLNWTTSFEINTDRFDVQVSKNGSADFKTVGTRAASSNSSTIKTYQFDYAMETGVVYYYRLKMLDKDGSFTYSVIRQLSCNDVKTQITIAPNPVYDVFKISGLAKGKNTITLSSTDGKMIKSQISSGTVVQVDISHLSKGIYIVRILNEDGSVLISKVIKN